MQNKLTNYLYCQQKRTKLDWLAFLLLSIEKETLGSLCSLFSVLSSDSSEHASPVILIRCFDLFRPPKESCMAMIIDVFFCLSSLPQETSTHYILYACTGKLDSRCHIWLLQGPYAIQNLGGHLIISANQKQIQVNSIWQKT